MHGKGCYSHIYILSAPMVVISPRGSDAPAGPDGMPAAVAPEPNMIRRGGHDTGVDEEGQHRGRYGHGAPGRRNHT